MHWEIGQSVPLKTIHSIAESILDAGCDRILLDTSPAGTLLDGERFQPLEFKLVRPSLAGTTVKVGLQADPVSSGLVRFEVNSRRVLESALELRLKQELGDSNLARAVLVVGDDEMPFREVSKAARAAKACGVAQIGFLSLSAD